MKANHFILRPAQWSDAEAVARLIYDACAAEGDTILAMSPEELKHEWQDPQFDMEKDVFVVTTPEGRIAEKNLEPPVSVAKGTKDEHPNSKRNYSRITRRFHDARGNS